MIPLGLASAAASWSARRSAVAARPPPCGRLDCDPPRGGFMTVSGLTLLQRPPDDPRRLHGRPGRPRDRPDATRPRRRLPALRRPPGRGDRRPPRRGRDPRADAREPPRLLGDRTPDRHVLAFRSRLGVLGLWAGLAAGIIAAALILVAAWTHTTRSLNALE